MIRQEMEMSPRGEWIAALCTNSKDDSKKMKTTHIYIYNLYSGIKTPDHVYTKWNKLRDSNLVSLYKDDIKAHPLWPGIDQL